MTVEHLDVGDGVELVVHEVLGAADGPTVALLGGVHGDEWEGILAVRQVLAGIGLRAGRVRAVAPANPPAHAAASRTSPLDGGNLARSFPGRPDGTVTERIADALSTRVIRGADLLVDLHSAGANYAMPFFAGYCDPAGEAAAFAFGAPVVWAHGSVNPGRSLTVAAEAGIGAIYVEGSGGGGLVKSEVDGYVRGVRRVLAHLHLVDEVLAPLPAEPMVLRGGDGDVDSSVASTVDGWCVTAARAGDVVRAGDLVAEIVDGAGAVVQRIAAPHAGTVMMLRRRAVITAGEGVVMLGPVPQGWAS